MTVLLNHARAKREKLGTVADTSQQKSNPSGWTIDTLKEHVLALLSANDTRYEQRFLSTEKLNAVAIVNADKAVAQAEIANEKRFDNTNEWRNAMQDRDKLTMSRDAADAKFQALTERIAAMDVRLEKTEASREGAGSTWKIMASVLGALLAIVSIIAIVERMGKI